MILCIVQNGISASIHEREWAWESGTIKQAAGEPYRVGNSTDGWLNLITSLGPSGTSVVTAKAYSKVSFI